ILKALVLVFVMMWVRWTLPRLRIDQVMMTCLKYLLPISCALLLGVSLWQVIVAPLPNATLVCKSLMSGACRLVVLFVVVELFTTRTQMPVGAAMTRWGPVVPPGPLGPRPMPGAGQISRN